MTIDRPDTDSAPELTEQFWGEQTEWTPQGPPRAARSGAGGVVGRWWNRLLGGDVDRERSHGRANAPSATDHQPADGAGDNRESSEGAWSIEPELAPERRGGVDPLIARLGGLAVIVTLAAPLIVGFTASGDETSSTPAPVVAIGDATQGSTAVPTSNGSDTEPPAATSTPATTTTTPAASAAAAAPAAAPDPAEASVSAASVADEVDASATESTSAVPEQTSNPALIETEPAATTPACGARYEVAAGDYWIRLADAAGSTLIDLLAVNQASVDTVLVPGRSICLPVGAATPAPPIAPAPARTTTSNTPATQSAPATTAAPAPPPEPATTAAPAPPPVPATTVPNRPTAVSTSQAAQIIRDVWPDDLEERALQIAQRESNLLSNVNNWCCYGLFQIHWKAHQSWLATIGVTSATQLYDPNVNASAAYTLYQRAGGFGPWGG